MSELYDQIVSQRGKLGNLTARIPGFRGYLDNKARRTADRMLRDYVAGLIEKRIARLTEIENIILDNGGLAHMSETRSAKTRLQTYHDRVKAAAPGYSGFFEAVKIGPDEMEKLYSFDEAQIRFADQFDEALDTLQQAAQQNEGLKEAIAALNQVSQDANEAFSLRESVLTDLDKSLGS
ncbi:MAG: hypothetical protein H6672_10455 [Anaerolineaceae bacterium]|nr:hypothetical protein [Anaerolineaceae bacterium]